MQNNPIDNLSDFQLTQEILVRGLERTLEDFTDSEIIDELNARGLEDEVNDYDNVRSLCGSILNELNTGQDINAIKPKIIELIQNVTGKIVCK